MSTGKRLAKRSILGTRVCAPKSNGLYMCGVIQSTKSDSEDQQTNVYCVYFDDKTSGEYAAIDLVGPGFRTVLDVVLQAGQTVYLTHNGREVRGTVLTHRPDTDDVELRLVGPAVINLKKRLEEVRLIESRKSARLQDTDTDYSRLAEGEYSSRLPEPRRRASSLSIDVPYGQSGRKRRSSADDGVMDDCMAAMVLMSLSCSPKSPCSGTNTGIFPPWGAASSSGASSYSSGVSGSTRATPSPPSHFLMNSANTSQDSPPSYHLQAQQQQDEGIDVDDSDTSSTFAGDDSIPAAKRKSPLRTKVVFQCTWPGCNKLYQHCNQVESHVRTVHLGRMDLDDTDEHEEEFYYTEIEVDSYMVGQMEPPSPETPDQDQGSPLMPSIYSSSVPTLSHLDMARPAHEDPEYRKLQQQQLQITNNVQISSPTAYVSAASPISIPQLHKSTAWHLHGYAASAPSTMQGSPQKCMRLSPKPLSSPTKTSSPLHSSNGRRTRSESRKCRKVYGMENRDMWCTQCKWKKACTRFVD